MNTHTKQVEIKVIKPRVSLNLYSQTSPQTEDIGSIQKGADFVRAFMLGFEIKVLLFLHKMLIHKGRYSTYQIG